MVQEVNCTFENVSHPVHGSDFGLIDSTFRNLTSFEALIQSLDQRLESKGLIEEVSKQTSLCFVYVQCLG